MRINFVRTKHATVRKHSRASFTLSDCMSVERHLYTLSLCTHRSGFDSIENAKKQWVGSLWIIETLCECRGHRNDLQPVHLHQANMSWWLARRLRATTARNTQALVLRVACVCWIGATSLWDLWWEVMRGVCESTTDCSNDNARKLFMPPSRP